MNTIHCNVLWGMLGAEDQLRSKRELIERFISDDLLNVASSDKGQSEFENFWTSEWEKSQAELCAAEGLKPFRRSSRKQHLNRSNFGTYGDLSPQYSAACERLCRRNSTHPHGQ